MRKSDVDEPMSSSEEAASDDGWSNAGDEMEMEKASNACVEMEQLGSCKGVGTAQRKTGVA
jgi:hypothetical protein